MLLCVGAAMAMTMSSCKEEQFTPTGDLFAPKFCADPVVRNHNDIALVWYPVNDAISYTVRLTTDTYKRDEFLVFDTEETVINIEDLPYGQAFNIQVRANSSDSKKTSQWATTAATTDQRPAYAQLLNGVDLATITYHEATVTWVDDPDNPVDEIGYYSPNDETVENIRRPLTEQEKAAHEVRLTELKEKTLYYVNVYDTNKPRKYDQPYNQIKFRTNGDPAAIIQIAYEDDLSTILNENNLDPDIPEGVVYELEDGSSYTIAPFAMRKGFILRGPADAESKPKLILNGTWNINSGSNIQLFSLENVQVGNKADAQYFFNGNGAYDLEEASFINCDFIDVRRGFWRQQGKLNRHVGEIRIDGCLFDHIGYQSSGYGTFHIEAEKGTTSAYDAIDNVTIRNTTFMRDGGIQETAWGWANLFYSQTTIHPVNILIENVTFYEFCHNSTMINILNTENSTVTVRNVVMASKSGQFLLQGSATKTVYTNNYATKDYSLGAASIGGVDYAGTAADLFVDPVNGNLTVKDKSSLIYSNAAGDPRWLK